STSTTSTISRCAGWNAPTCIVPPRPSYAGPVGAGPAGPSPSGARSPILAPQLAQNRAPAALCTPQRGQYELPGDPLPGDPLDDGALPGGALAGDAPGGGASDARCSLRSWAATSRLRWNSLVSWFA